MTPLRPPHDRGSNAAGGRLAPLSHAGSVPNPQRLPRDLAGPVNLAAARSSDVVPAEAACRGGCRYELKWDGYRIAIVRTSSAARLWSRRGTDLTSAFPDLAAAAEFHLRPGTVLDGEAVIWADRRLSFDLLQRRLVRRASRGVPPGPPASYVAFDLLALGGDDQRRRTYSTRRQLLERLAANWAPPLQLCPSTTSRDEALKWAEDYRAAGIEGLVIKPASSRYAAGRSDWIKVNSVRLMILKCRQSLVWRSLPCPRRARHVLRTGRRPRRRGVAVSHRQRLPSTRFGRALSWLALSKIEWMT